MSDSEDKNIVEQSTSIPSWLAEIPKAFVPSSLKAIDRLIGAAVDYPIALLRRKTAQIDSQTKAFELVEAAIAKSAGDVVGADPDIVKSAIQTLVRKEYRKQSNKEAIVVEAISHIKDTSSPETETSEPRLPPDEDWLNVFERFAEDASTERMQQLWGRVLGGEIRKPGSFSLRTLRILSEFSQSDAIKFTELCNSTVKDFTPKQLILNEEKSNISNILALEAAGLISGATSTGIFKILPLDQQGQIFFGEQNLSIIFFGKPNTIIELEGYKLTKVGIELLALIPNRDIQTTMRKFANAVRTPEITAACIAHKVSATEGVSRFQVIEKLW